VSKLDFWGRKLETEAKFVRCKKGTTNRCFACSKPANGGNGWLIIPGDVIVLCRRCAINKMEEAQREAARVEALADKEVDLGELQIRDGGGTEKITALFTVFRDDREATMARTEKGTLVVSTKSRLRENDHELVQTVYAFTPQTFALMAEAMMLGSKYFGIDLYALIASVHASDGDRIKYEYAGCGVPDFSEFK